MIRALGLALALAIVGCATPQVRGAHLPGLTLEDALSDHTTPHALIAGVSPFIVTNLGVGCASCALTGASLTITATSGNAIVLKQGASLCLDVTCAHGVNTNGSVVGIATAGGGLSVDGTSSFQGLLINATGGTLAVPTTDSTGTPGAATINKMSGDSAIAAAASSAVITNSTASAASRIFVQSQNASVDTTCKNLRVSSKGSGTFTVACDAAATATTKFDWWVLN